MRDETLVENLCQTLKMILGGRHFWGPPSMFGRRLGFLPSSLDGEHEHEVEMWTQNKSKSGYKTWILIHR